LRAERTFSDSCELLQRGSVTGLDEEHHVTPTPALDKKTLSNPGAAEED